MPLRYPSDRLPPPAVKTHMKDGFKADKAILALQRAIIIGVSPMQAPKEARVPDNRLVLTQNIAKLLPAPVIKSGHLAIEDFVGLQNWLEVNQPALYAELYEAPEASEVDAVVPLDQCEQVGDIHSVPELGRHAARIRSGLEDGRDPELAIGSAKELLESVLRQLFVRKEFRRRGIATRMVQTWADEFAFPLTAAFGVESPNADTRRILIRLGYAYIDGERIVGTKCRFWANM